MKLLIALILLMTGFSAQAGLIDKEDHRNCKLKAAQQAQIRNWKLFLTSNGESKAHVLNTTCTDKKGLLGGVTSVDCTVNVILWPKTDRDVAQADRIKVEFNATCDTLRCVETLRL